MTGSVLASYSMALNTGYPNIPTLFNVTSIVLICIYNRIPSCYLRDRCDVVDVGGDTKRSDGLVINGI